MCSVELFKEIAKVPRPSKHEGKIRAFLLEKAKMLGYATKEDQAGNILIQVPGAGTQAGSDCMVLQSHMDMVCEKTPESNIDFMNDGLELYEEDGFLKAKNTTLGADNGIGIALSFFCAQLKNHPPLELLITVDEEAGMSGAAAVQPGFFTGRRLLNIDSSHFGEITTGCSGGNNSEFTIPVKYENDFVTPDASLVWQVSVVGLKGGHSGLDINKGRVSATQLMGRILQAWQQAGLKFRLASIAIGAANNAIARDGVMSVVFATLGDVETAKQMNLSTLCKSEDGEQLEVLFGAGDVADCSAVFDEQSQNKLIALLNRLPHGVLSWSKEGHKLPQTSINMASVKQSESGVCVKVSYRSFDNATLPQISQDLAGIAGELALEVKVSEAYPAWPPAKHNELLELTAPLYEKLFDKEVKIKAVHAGLECGYWEIVSPGLITISIGATIMDLHSPTECLELASVGWMEQLLEALMAVA